MDEAATHDTHPAVPRETGVTLQRPVIVALLYLLNVVLGITVFVGLVLAYVWRAEPDTAEWERSHYTYLIRTFWLALAAAGLLALGLIVTAIAMAGLTGQSDPPAAFFGAVFGWMALWIVLAIWTLVRSILSLVRAGERKPMPNPRTLLW